MYTCTLLRFKASRSRAKMMSIKIMMASAASIVIPMSYLIFISSGRSK